MSSTRGTANRRHLARPLAQRATDIAEAIEVAERGSAVEEVHDKGTENTTGEAPVEQTAGDPEMTEGQVVLGEGERGRTAASPAPERVAGPERRPAPGRAVGHRRAPRRRSLTGPQLQSSTRTVGRARARRAGPGQQRRRRVRRGEEALQRPRRSRRPARHPARWPTTTRSPVCPPPAAGRAVPRRRSSADGVLQREQRPHPARTASSAAASLSSSSTSGRAARAQRSSSLPGSNPPGPVSHADGRPGPPAQPRPPDEADGRAPTTTTRW